MVFNNYYEEPKGIVFNGKKNGIKALDNRKDGKKEQESRPEEGAE